MVATNKCPQGSYRGWGVPAHNLAMEHCVDLAARKLGLDPVEIRRRNLLRPEQFPYEAPNGARYDSGDYERTLNLALEMAGYRAMREEQSRARAERRLVGIGVYTGVELSAVAMSMKPAPFRLFRPKSVDEALALLQSHGDEAKVLAGGQSLVPLMNFRLAQPHNLIDLNGVEGLDQIKFNDQTLSLGAMTGSPLDPSSPDGRLVCKAGFDCTKPIGKPFAERLSISKEVLDHIDPLKIIGEKHWSEIPVEPWG